MKIGQLYYTSSKKGLRQKSGFQVYAVSGDLSDQEIREIEPYCVYMQPLDVPSQPLDEEIKELFPIKNMYIKIGEQTQVVIKIHYVGKDYTNRYGNYFCHALVLKGEHELLAPELLESYTFKTNLDGLEEVEEIPVLATLTNRDVMIQGAKSEVKAFIKKHKKECQLLVDKALIALKEEKRIILSCPKEDILSYLTVLHYVLPKSLADACTFSTYSQQPAQETCLITGILPTGNRFSLSEVQYNSQFMVLDFNDLTKLKEIGVSDEVEMLLELVMKEKYEQYLSWFKQVNSIEKMIWLYDFIKQPEKEPKGGYKHVVDLVAEEKLEIMIEELLQINPTIDTPYLKTIFELQRHLQSKKIQEKLIQQYHKWAECLLNEQDERVFENGLHKIYQLPMTKANGTLLLEKQDMRIFWIQASERLLACRGTKALALFKQEALDLLVSICKGTVPSVWPPNEYDRRQNVLSKAISQQILSLPIQKRQYLLLDLASNVQGRSILCEAITYTSDAIKKEVLEWIIQSKVVNLEFLLAYLWKSYYDSILYDESKNTLQSWLEINNLMEKGTCEIVFKEMVYKQIDACIERYMKEVLKAKDYERLMKDTLLWALIAKRDTDIGQEMIQLKRWMLASTKEEKEAILAQEEWPQEKLELALWGGIAYSQTREALLANYECFRVHTQRETILQVIEELVAKQTREAFIIAVRLVLVCFSIEVDTKWSEELLSQWILSKKKSLILQESKLLLNKREQEKINQFIKSVNQHTTLIGKLISKLIKIGRGE